VRFWGFVVRLQGSLRTIPAPPGRALGGLVRVFRAAVDGIVWTAVSGERRWLDAL
jgi:hypothetical protein